MNDQNVNIAQISYVKFILQDSDEYGVLKPLMLCNNWVWKLLIDTNLNKC